MLGFLGNRWKAVTGVSAVAAFGVAWVTGSLHDYVWYVRQWSAAFNGIDPWLPDLGNAYGPSFLIFAPAAEVHPLVPKMFFVLVWFAIAYYILAHSKEIARSYVLLILILNPFVWIEIVWFGHFDIITAGLMLVAVVFVELGRIATGGAVLGVGFLFKFYPAVLVPYLSRRLGRMGLGFFVVSILGVVVTYMRWGTSVSDTFRYGVSRSPKMLSPFRTAETAVSYFDLDVDFSVLSLPLIALGLIWFYWYSRNVDISPRIAAPVSMLIVLAFYKVGHPQFHMPVVVLLAYLFSKQPQALRTRSVAAASLAYLGLLAIFSVMYLVGGNLRPMPWVLVRQWGGLPAFLVEVWLIWALLRFDNSEVARRSQRVSVA